MTEGRRGMNLIKDHRKDCEVCAFVNMTQLLNATDRAYQCIISQRERSCPAKAQSLNGNLTKTQPQCVSTCAYVCTHFTGAYLVS